MGAGSSVQLTRSRFVLYLRLFSDMSLNQHFMHNTRRSDNAKQQRSVERATVQMCLRSVSERARGGRGHARSEIPKTHAPLSLTAFGFGIERRIEH